MHVSYSKKTKPPYINFRMRKLINALMLENAEKMVNMDVRERSQFIADEVEKLVCENYWIKDKRGVNKQELKKIA